MTDPSPPLALVTGGNRGLGLETVRQLSAAGYRVLLGARDPSAGLRAAEDFGPGPVEAVALDVTDAQSVADAAGRVAELGPLQALVNNAGVALDGFDADVVAKTIDVNVRGAARVFDAVRPHLEADARVVNVSSGMGELSCVSPTLRTRFLDESLDVDGLFALLDEFHDKVKRDAHENAGWPSSAYRVSKVGLNALTRILHRTHGDKLVVNAVCPGWVRTDMGGEGAPRDVAEGAETIAWLAQLPPDGPRGTWFRDRKKINW